LKTSHVLMRQLSQLQRQLCKNMYHYIGT
jgi:hypothetical protein